MNTAVTAVYGADTGPLRTGSAEGESIIGNFASNAKATLGEIGAGFVSGFLVSNVAGRVLSFFDSIIEKAQHLRVMTLEFGLSSDAIQLFDKAVVKTGGSLEQAQKVWERTRDALSQLADHEDSATKAFAKLHLTAQDFLGLTLDEALEKIAAAFIKSKDEAGAYNAYLEIIGKRGGPQLLAALNQLGTEGFDGLNQKSQNLSDTLKGGAAEAMAGLSLKATEYTNRMKNFLGNIAGGFLEALGAVGSLTAAGINAVTGLKTDWDEVLGLNKKFTAALEEQKQIVIATGNAAQEAHDRLDKFTKGADDAARERQKAKDAELKSNQAIADSLFAQEEKELALTATANKRAAAEASVLSEFEQQLVAIQKLAGSGSQGFQVGSDGMVSIGQLTQAAAEAQRALEYAKGNNQINSPGGIKNVEEAQALVDQANRNLDKAKFSVISADNATRVNANSLDFSSIIDTSAAAGFAAQASAATAQGVADTNKKLAVMNKNIGTLLHQFFDDIRPEPDPGAVTITSINGVSTVGGTND